MNVGAWCKCKSKTLSQTVFREHFRTHYQDNRQFNMVYCGHKTSGPEPNPPITATKTSIRDDDTNVNINSRQLFVDALWGLLLLSIMPVKTSTPTPPAATLTSSWGLCPQR